MNLNTLVTQRALRRVALGWLLLTGGCMSQTTLQTQDSPVAQPSGKRFPVDLRTGAVATPIAERWLVAWGSTTALVVWQDSADYTLYGARINLEEHSVLDSSPITIASARSPSDTYVGNEFSIAFDGSNYLVAWPADSLRATRIRESDGALLDVTPDAPGILIRDLGASNIAVTYSTEFRQLQAFRFHHPTWLLPQG